MRIAGVQGATVIDFPGRIASVVFLAGCDLRCPFCQNPDLVEVPKDMYFMDLDYLLQDLEKRKRLVDGLVISGGEPLLNDLVPLLRASKEMGYQIKLDTNGNHPDRFSRLVEQGLVDMAGLDVKTDKAGYARLGGAATEESWERVLRCIDISVANDLELDVRTTVVPGFVNEAVIERIASSISELGVGKYTLQQFVPDHCFDPEMRKEEPFPNEKVRNMADIAARYVQDVSIRGLVGD